MILLTRASRVFTYLFSLRYSRVGAYLSLALTLFATCLLWQPGSQAHAYGRLAIHAPDGDTFPLPEAKAGSPYEFQFQTEGGLAPLKWSVSNLPPGLRLEENGKLHGVPAQAQAEAFAFTVTVTDSSRPPQQFTLPCLLLVKAAPLRIVTRAAAPLRIVTGNGAAPAAPGNLVAADTLMADVVATPAAANLQDARVSLTLKQPLLAGSKIEIFGTTKQPDDVFVTIEFHDEGANKGLMPIKEMKVKPDVNGNFTLKLPGTFALKDKVLVEQKVAGLMLRSQAVVVETGKVEVEKKAPAAAHFEQPLYGATVIHGSATADLKVSVLLDGKPVPLLGEDGKPKDADGKDILETTVNKKGEFTAALVSPLNRDKHEVIAIQVRDTVSGKQTDTEAIPIKAIGDLYNWGRVRAYFSAGVIFSKQRQSFSQQDPMLAFNLDKNWWNASRANKSPFRHFNTFFEARLTSIPVVTPESSNASTTSNQTSDAQQCRDISNGLTCFLASRKAAQMQVGGYIPIYSQFMTWKYGADNNAVFLAPLAKFGVQTITSEEVDQLRLANNGDPNYVLNGDDVYNYFAFGTRLGHYRLPTSANVAPELISYLDLTLGKWENFDLRRGQLCNAPANSGKFDCENGNGTVLLGGKPVYIRERRFRAGFEGRLKVPETPLFVGFDANFGKGPDDLRFLFGTRFDVGSLFGRLKFLQALDK
jgi:hypothetical protein